eukprot:1967759-Pyramimonas_sp.AAC.1
MLARTPPLPDSSRPPQPQAQCGSNLMRGQSRRGQILGRVSKEPCKCFIQVTCASRGLLDAQSGR